MSQQPSSFRLLAWLSDRLLRVCHIAKSFFGPGLATFNLCFTAGVLKYFYIFMYFKVIKILLQKPNLEIYILVFAFSGQKYRVTD